MLSIDERFARLGVQVPRVLLPSKTVDLHKWAVIACDQHTSEPDYWKEVEKTVGDAPSTFELVLPEVYLGTPDEEKRIEAIRRQMDRYLRDGLLVENEPGFVLTVRQTPHVCERRGLMMALDLEMYDFTPGATPLIRATEQTILERIPPRVRVRRSAPLELPHVLVLIDDADNELFGGLTVAELPLLYETELMLDGGHVSGYHVSGKHAEHVAAALESLLSKVSGEKPFLFAVGDGNHSLATAKVVWDELKSSVSSDHPARYALVEVINLYDPGLRFEPIHRLIRTTEPLSWIRAFASSIDGTIEEHPLDAVSHALTHDKATIGYVCAGHSGLIRLRDADVLPVAAAQEQINSESGLEVDYIHGWDASVQLAGRPETAVVLLPKFDPRLLYPTLRGSGVLPRKSFSLGEPEEKRYYLEVRRIAPV